MKLAQVLLPLGLAAAASAQIGPDLFLTFSQSESTLSGSGGTVLQALRPNEIQQIQYSTTPCSASAEKWMPRTCSHVMAGDENGDGLYWNPTIFGRIDALLALPVFATGAASHNQRNIYWSVEAPIGPVVSATPFRPGDVAHIVRNALGDGQVEHFMRQEQFNFALGLPLATPIDVDAIAFGPNHGVFFSLDADIVAMTACGAALVRDGDVLCIPPWALTLTSSMTIGGVMPTSAVVVYTEAQMDAFVAAATVTDRFGACIPNAIDTESLEIDQFSASTTIVMCSGLTLTAPTLVFSTETMTGASLLTTLGGGQIYNTSCGPAGTLCGFGPTFGPQLGIQPAGAIGAPSFVNALAFGRAERHVLEPQQHVLNVFPFGAAAGSTMIDYGSPYAFNFALIEIVPPVVAPSLPAFPFSLLCFPDLYAPSINVYWWPLPGPWGTFPMVAIPPGWSGKVLYQNVGFGGSGLELSTPTVIHVQ